MSRLFYWRNMFEDIKDYVNQCVFCQRNKRSNQHPHGFLQPLTFPDDRWQSVGIVFITGLRKSNGFDAQSERTNRTVLETLRMYVNESNTNWSE